VPNEREPPIRDALRRGARLATGFQGEADYHRCSTRCTSRTASLGRSRSCSG
jgi:hypothetical protein